VTGSAFTPALPRSTEYGVHSQLFGIRPYAVVALADFVFAGAIAAFVGQSDRRTPVIAFIFLAATVYTLV
jgi:hypothetical protein